MFFFFFLDVFFLCFVPHKQHSVHLHCDDRKEADISKAGQMKAMNSHTLSALSSLKMQQFSLFQASNSQRETINVLYSSHGLQPPTEEEVKSQTPGTITPSIMDENIPKMLCKPT